MSVSKLVSKCADQTKSLNLAGFTTRLPERVVMPAPAVGVGGWRCASRRVGPLQFPAAAVLLLVVGGRLGGGHDGASISSRNSSGGSREKRTCFYVRRRTEPSSNSTSYALYGRTLMTFAFFQSSSSFHRVRTVSPTASGDLSRAPRL